MDFTPAQLLGSLIASSIGMGLFLYGKREARPPQLVVGVAMMLYPALVPGALAMLGIGLALLAGLWGALQAGW